MEKEQELNDINSIYRFIKNVPTSIKMASIGLPAVIMLIIVTLIMVGQIQKTNKETSDILYNQLHIPAVDLLNADRDLYQAYVAESELRVLWESEKSNVTDLDVDAVSSATISKKSSDVYIGEISENISQVLERVQSAYSHIKENESLYTYRYGEENLNLKEVYTQFFSHYEEWLKSYDAVSGEGDYSKHLTAFELARNDLNTMTDILNEYSENSMVLMDAEIDNNAMSLFFIISIVIIVIIAFSAIVILQLIKTLKYLTSISQRIANGELTLEIDKKMYSKDDLGKLSISMGEILNKLGEYYNYIQEITKALNTMSTGDMNISLTQSYDGEFKQIKEGLLGISNSLSNTLSHINMVASQVNAGAEQVSSGAQALAVGASEQASSIEELTATVSSISEQAINNRENVTNAKGYIESVNKGVKESNNQMGVLSDAVKDIRSSADKIVFITKSINDIAFQTNILSLNAAIEAARAGAVGKGFSVVAEEVRNLSAKSAQAAKETEELIKSAILAVENGEKCAVQTAKALEGVSKSTSEIIHAFEEIENSSVEQSQAISQVNVGLEQVSAIVQSNAATAEENSASSEEMSAQASTLRNEVGKFKIIGHSENSTVSKPLTKSSKIDLSRGMGKY